MPVSNTGPKAFKILISLLLAATLAACATVDRSPGEGGDRTPADGSGGGAGDARGAGDAGVEVRGLGDGEGIALDPLEDPDSPLSQRVIHFGFDEDTVAAQYLDLIAAHGDYLARNPEQTVRLEGHTDERGTREYNLALGERRARAVQRMLELQGASADQIQVVSYGEEMPVDPASNEAAWEQNRRVEIVYEGDQG
ncbi:peptidoglycan-associated lipoprotein Pal [Ectothiorhodospira mobilis]|uniref:peptidoglycan-associated lipoprotein Pal n=1 Tax=Ectothiorhodospira mobilis TaxID=195064 RepID=UPI001EE80D4D|nr:peptidoglycan-associated lipoprotein Pal [Ectothiorhodospira mobilis]MCG5534462.1 peptidoglycan-associated lipoprotein Pal [Ectothiorhodospira mobilis]